MSAPTKPRRPTAALRAQKPLAGTLKAPREPGVCALVVVAGLIAPGAAITIQGVIMDGAMLETLQTLSEMGSDITVENLHKAGGQDIADLQMRNSELRGIIVPVSRASSMKNAYPALALAAACAHGRTEMRGLENLREPGTAPLVAIASGLAACKVEVQEGNDYLIVEGRGPAVGGCTVATQGNPWIALSFLILGMAARDAVIVDDAMPIAKIYPEFITDFVALGAQFQVLEATK